MSVEQSATGATVASLQVGKQEGASALSAAEVARRIRHQRARKLFVALALWVGLPTLLSGLYYGLVASNQYESVTTLMIRGSKSDAEQNAVMLREYALSRDLLTLLDSTEHIFEHYQSGGDPFSRLSKNAGSEARYEFYRKHVDADYDAHSGVFTLRVRAFSGAEAARLARAVLDAGRAFASKVDPASRTSFVVISQPSRPNQATYPHRAYNVLTAFLVSLALFGIGSLLTAAVREHAQF